MCRSVHIGRRCFGRRSGRTHGPSSARSRPSMPRSKVICTASAIEPSTPPSAGPCGLAGAAGRSSALTCVRMAITSPGPGRQGSPKGGPCAARPLLTPCRSPSWAALPRQSPRPQQRVSVIVLTCRPVSPASRGDTGSRPQAPAQEGCSEADHLTQAAMRSTRQTAQILQALRNNPGLARARASRAMMFAGGLPVDGIDFTTYSNHQSTDGDTPDSHRNRGRYRRGHGRDKRRRHSRAAICAAIAPGVGTVIGRATGVGAGASPASWRQAPSTTSCRRAGKA